jgi:hypothetical protein
MEKTFQTLNDLEARGLVTRYAIGGAFGWSFYTEPIVTFDVDVFVFLPNSDSPLVSLSPIYDHLRGLGCEVRHEHVMIAGTAIQFLVARNPRGGGKGVQTGSHPGLQSGTLDGRDAGHRTSQRFRPLGPGGRIGRIR